MPRYDYYCPSCRWFEAWRGVEDSFTPCPACGAPAKRAACSGLPAIKGETVGKNYASSGGICPGDIKNKHGQYRVKLWQESQAEAARVREKER